jgi:hypothetical protein
VLIEGVLVDSGPDEVLGRRERTDQVGLERSAVMSISFLAPSSPPPGAGAGAGASEVLIEFSLGCRCCFVVLALSARRGRCALPWVRRALLFCNAMRQRRQRPGILELNTFVATYY